jgi:arginine repressor
VLSTGQRSTRLILALLQAIDGSAQAVSRLVDRAHLPTGAMATLQG